MACRTSLTPVTPPSAEVISLTEAKNWIKQDGADDDGLITSLIQAAREAAEKYTRRAFITQVWKLTLDQEMNGYGYDLPAGSYDLPISTLYGGLPNIIELPLPPLQGVTSVTTYDLSNAASVYSASNYIVDLAGQRIVLNSTAIWPGTLRCRPACEVVFTVGYGGTAATVPLGIKNAMLMHIQRMYDERLISKLPPTSEQLLRSYKVYGER